MERYFKTLLFITVIIFCGGTAPAQLRYGFRFGGAFADARLHGAEGASLVNRSGFSGGLALEYQMPRCGFAPDVAVVYTRSNTRLIEGDSKPESFGRNFIEIPVRLKYKFFLGAFHDLFGPMVYTGPAVAFRVGGDANAPLSAKRVRAGWDAGVGFDIVNFIQISGGYRFGLGNAADKYPGYPDASLRANSWSIDVTLLFDF